MFFPTLIASSWAVPDFLHRMVLEIGAPEKLWCFPDVFPVQKKVVELDAYQI